MASVTQRTPLIVTFGVVPEFGLNDSMECLLANSYSQQATIQKYEQPNAVSSTRGLIYYGQALSANISGAVPARGWGADSSVAYTQINSDPDSSDQSLTALQVAYAPFLCCVMTDANLDTSVLNTWLVDDDEPTYTAYCEAANDSRNVGQPHNRDYSMSVYPF